MERDYTKILSSALPNHFSVSKMLEIIIAYAQPHRVYHTMEHVLYMLNAYGQIIGDERADWRHVLAIIYHDVVYDSKRTDNEEKSVEFFESHFPWTAGVNKEIGQAILDTKKFLTYDPENIDDFSKPVLDCDLSALAAPYTIFYDNQFKIGQEYGIFGDAVRENSTAFMKKVLERKYIYYKPKARELWEKRARFNMETWVKLND